MALWAFVTKGVAIFHVSKSSNHEVALEILKEHSGTDIHDRHSAFESLAGKAKNPQQYCRSHVIMDAGELEQFYGEEGRNIKESLQLVHEKAKSFHGHGTTGDVDHLHEKLTFTLQRDYEHPGCRKFVDNLLKRRREWFFRFVVDPEVESTNNRSERALRSSVMYRKVSGGTRSERGSEAYGKLSSTIYTQKLRKKSFIGEGHDIIKGKRPNPG